VAPSTIFSDAPQSRPSSSTRTANAYDEAKLGRLGFTEKLSAEFIYTPQKIRKLTLDSFVTLHNLAG
jgi:hypothetical protein